MVQGDCPEMFTEKRVESVFYYCSLCFAIRPYAQTVVVSLLTVMSFFFFSHNHVTAGIDFCENWWKLFRQAFRSSLNPSGLLKTATNQNI